MRELALFAGVGGGILGGRLLGWRSVCYVENNAYCIEVLKARIAEGYLCDAPIWGDIKTFDGRPWSGCVDVVTAGFPCQPFSVAGKQRADGDERNLWPETVRIIREVRPRYALLENVPGLLHGSHGYFGRVLGNLAESGYDARWRIVSAADVGAPHLRKRLWAYCWDATRNHDSEVRSFREGQDAESVGTCPDVANTQSPGLGREYQGRLLAEAQRGSEEVADTISEGLEGRQGKQSNDGTELQAVERGSNVANTNSTAAGPEERGCLAKADRVQGVYRQEYGTAWMSGGAGGNGSGYAESQLRWWGEDPAERPVESRVGRLADGIPDRMERQKGIGNAQVPGVVALAWELLTGGG